MTDMLQNAGVKILKQIDDLPEGSRAITWFYSALWKFHAAGMNVSQVMDELENIEPDWIRAWKARYCSRS